MLTRDIEEADLRTNANTKGWRNFRKPDRAQPLNDIRDLMHQAEPTLPQPDMVLESAIAAWAFSYTQLLACRLTGVSL